MTRSILSCIVATLMFGFCQQPLVATTAESANDYKSLNHEARGDKYKQIHFGRDYYNFWSHFTLSSNLLDLALIIPNLGVEVDLGNPNRMSTPSLYFQFKGSPTGRDYLQKGIYDQYSYKFWNAHGEIRWHFSFHHHPEFYKGRFYAGIYGEYGDYTMRTPVDPYDRDCLKDGWAWTAGLSGGYDFPWFSYGNRHFFQLQVGGNIGAIHTEYDAWNDEGCTAKRHTFPMLTELRVALTYRNYSISHKYWQPNLERYARHKAEDQYVKQQLDELVDNMEQEPLTLYVKPAPGNDSIFIHPVSFNEVRNAFRKNYKNEYFRIDWIHQLPENTAFPLTQPGENYRVEYSVPMRSENYDSNESELTYVLPFRLRFEGYDEALERELSYNRALRKFYYDNDKHLPTLYVEAKSLDQFTASVHVEQILPLLNEKWGDGELQSNEVEGIYYRKDGEFIPINQGELTRPGTYAFGLRFHQQVSENYDTLACRFNLEPYIDDEDQEMYDNFMHTNRTINIQHPWKNGHETSVSRHEVVQAFVNQGCTGITEDNIQIEDPTHFGRNVGSAKFGNLLPAVPFVYIVDDAESVRIGEEIQKALKKGLIPQSYTWYDYVKDNMTYGPMVQGKYNNKHQLVPVDKNALHTGLMQYLTRLNPALANVHFDPDWVESYNYSGIHEIPGGTGRACWTVLRFAYRYSGSDGRTHVGYANVAYRLKYPGRK